MKCRSSQIAALTLVLLAPSLSAQVVRAREGVILRQPISKREAMSSRMMIATDPLTSVTITTSPAPPNLPTPSFQALSINDSEGAQNDADGRIIRTNLSLTGGENQACPISVMFSFGAGSPAVPAAGWYTTTASTAPAHERYPFLYGGAYFRPPPVPDEAFPGGQPSPPQTKNSWVHLVNCRGEYSNALPFRVEPMAFQLTRVGPNGFIGGQQVIVHGTGLEGLLRCSGTWCPATQKVMFAFKLGKNNATNTALDIVERELEAPLLGNTRTERRVNVYAPSLEGQGYTRASWVLLDAKVYVLRKDGTKSNALPVRYCSSAENTALAGACW